MGWICSSDRNARNAYIFLIVKPLRTRYLVGEAGDGRIILK